VTASGNDSAPHSRTSEIATSSIIGGYTDVDSWPWVGSKAERGRGQARPPGSADVLGSGVGVDQVIGRSATLVRYPGRCQIASAPEASLADRFAVGGIDSIADAAGHQSPPQLALDAERDQLAAQGGSGRPRFALRNQASASAHRSDHQCLHRAGSIADRAIQRRRLACRCPRPCDGRVRRVKNPASRSRVTHWTGIRHLVRGSRAPHRTRRNLRSGWLVP